jgi:hypothetical protein
MLRFGFFPGFKGADTLLIWGDADGVFQFCQLLVRLSVGTEKRAALHAMTWASARHNLAVYFEVSPHEALHIDRAKDAATIHARFTAERFAEFADKVAAFDDSSVQSGHQYLDWPGTANVQIMVSKNEYSADFGDPN